MPMASKEGTQHRSMQLLLVSVHSQVVSIPVCFLHKWLRDGKYERTAILCAGAARQAFLVKADTPGTSDVEAALDQKAEEYIALLLGIINALPKPHPKGSKDSSNVGVPGDAEGMILPPSCDIFVTLLH